MPAFGQPKYDVGSLVRVRGRDWVVVPSDQEEVLRLRPLSGKEEEAIGIHQLIEGSQVKPASFPDPNPAPAGDYVGGKLLRSAARLSLRSGAGPFRSLGRVSVRPRPYQFVPLLMALRLEPVRLLIADDVGVGKTIEAGLIARELLDRGDARRLCVLCPPHLCDQWRVELEQKFHIHPVVVRTSTITWLERNIPRGGPSVYGYYPHLIVSIDLAKSDRRRHLFLMGCPDLVIVDEAHAAADPGVRGAHEQQQRHQLLCEIAGKPDRHLLLLTATPHSGVEDSFRSLLALLRPQFDHFDLQNMTEAHRKSLALHLVQRRRADVAKWLGADTPFPERVPPFEETYSLTDEYKKLFEDVLEFTRRTVQLPELQENRRRVRYWAALTLLRCLMSSPASAIKAFSARVDETIEAAAGDGERDELRSREVLDGLGETANLDTDPETAVELGVADLAQSDRARLKDFRQRAQAIADSGKDSKIEKAARVTLDMLQNGCRPIVYCRFVATAQYVAEELERRLKRHYTSIRTKAVTSETGDDEEREAALASLVESEKRVLVATDCLSEGINLQDHFDAVVHYDLPWNPNRLEQREGRVDRFGQPRREVRGVVLFTPDSLIDGIVLNALLRKARDIYRTLGVSIAIPANSESVAQALVRAVFQGWKQTGAEGQLRLDLGEVDTVKALHLAWDREAEREKESRTRFAQHAIRPDEVACEIEATDSVLGDPQAVRRFVLDACQRLGIGIADHGRYHVLETAKLPGELRQRLNWAKWEKVRVVFDSPPPHDVENALVLGRNHPLVAYLSDQILGMAFRPKKPEDNFRCGAAYTSAVKSRTVIMLLRVRYTLSRRGQTDQFAEEVVTTGYRSVGGQFTWFPPNDPQVLELLESPEPAGNITPAEKEQRVQRALEEVQANRVRLKEVANTRARELELAHERLKQQIGGSKVKATPHDPDLLGIHVLLPGGKS
jgi:superfamily II DNA or RNA helicase